MEMESCQEALHAYAMKDGVAPTAQYGRVRTIAQEMEHARKMVLAFVIGTGGAMTAQRHGAQVIVIIEVRVWGAWVACATWVTMGSTAGFLHAPTTAQDVVCVWQHLE